MQLSLISQNDQTDIAPEPHLRQIVDRSLGHGQIFEITDGIWLARIELSGKPSHVNIYILRGRKGWVLIDTGNNTQSSRDAIESIFSSQPFCNAPLRFVIATHFHPEHIGLVGILCRSKTRLICTRTCWTTAKLLVSDSHLDRRPEQIEFLRLAGLSGIELEALLRNGRRRYCDMVAVPPACFVNISQGDKIKIGERIWRVELGNGHAADHATLWSDDNFVISGDQILPAISSNLSVPPNEPESDTVSQWIESCSRFGALANYETICLPGHNLPFVGVPQRCEQLKNNHVKAIERLFNHLATPRKAIDCLYAVYRRDLSPIERGSLIAETMGYLNHLKSHGFIQRRLVNNAYIWSRCTAESARDAEKEVASPGKFTLRI